MTPETYATLRRIARYSRQYDSLTDMAVAGLISERLLSKRERDRLNERAEVLERQIEMMKSDIHVTPMSYPVEAAKERRKVEERA